MIKYRAINISIVSIVIGRSKYYRWGGLFTIQKKKFHFHFSNACSMKSKDFRCRTIFSTEKKKWFRIVSFR